MGTELALYVIGILLGVIGFFLARLVNDVKSNTEKIGQNKGEIKLVSQKQIQDMDLLQRTTQLEIKQLTEQVSALAASVQTLVEIQMKNSK